MDLITTFGQWMKFRRKSLDLTQEQLAQQVGCSPAAVKKIESNERRPSRQVALLLAERLQLSPAQCDVFVRVARGELPLERLPLPRTETLPPDPQRSQEPSAAPHGALNAQISVPHPATPLIGRERELAEITRLVQDPQCRLLTLTGVGGTGKTRLAVEAALKMQAVFADGVYFVSLAGVDSPSLITQAIASVLGMTFSGPTDPRLQLFHYLREKQMLLVLDNLEHLLDGVGLFSELLQNAPEINLLATSREQLHIDGEWVFEVRGLPVPLNPQADAIEASSASRLFIQRARQAQSNFQVNEADYAAIGRICQLVQGLPLAIELAARWTRVLSCAEIANEIERGLEFLAMNTRDSARDVSVRHRSLQAVFDHSWNLLSEDERLVLKQLSIFRGGFRREAAEQIADANLPVLLALIDKSLLWRSESNRYDLHELVRQYLAAHLAENETEQRAASCKHSGYYLTLLRTGEPALRSNRQKEALAELDADMDNIRLAWNNAVDNGLFGLLGESAEPLYYYYELQQNFAEAEVLYRQAADAVRLQIEGTGRSVSVQEQQHLQVIQASLTSFQAFFNMRMGNNREALSLFETSLSALRPLREDPSKQGPFSLAFALVHMGVVYWSIGDFELAARHMEEGLQLSGSLEQSWLRGLALAFLGAIRHDRGDYNGACDRLHEAIKLFQADGDPYLVLFIGTYYSRTLIVLNRLEEAQALLQEALRGIPETGNRWLTALGLEYLARIARLSRNDSEAGRWLEKSVLLHREVGDPWSLTLALLELSRFKLQCADLTGAEAYTLEALKMTAATGSTPIALEGLGILAAICVERGMNSEALCLVNHILHHPSSKQDTREQAEKMQLEISAALDRGSWEAAQNNALPARFDALLKDRFGVSLPSNLL